MAGRSTENRCVWTGADFKLPVSQIALPRRTLRKRAPDTRRTHSQRAARPLARAPEKPAARAAEKAAPLTPIPEGVTWWESADIPESIRRPWQLLEDQVRKFMDACLADDAEGSTAHVRDFFMTGGMTGDDEITEGAEAYFEMQKVLQASGALEMFLRLPPEGRDVFIESSLSEVAGFHAFLWGGGSRSAWDSLDQPGREAWLRWRARGYAGAPLSTSSSSRQGPCAVRFR